MIITLKDGSTKEYSEPKSIIEIATDISEGLARMACAGEVNGEVEDLRTVIDKDCNLSILTFNDELRSCITQDCDKQELRQIVAKTDFVSMVHNADRLVEKGVTTVEEVCRTVSLLD